MKPRLGDDGKTVLGDQPPTFGSVSYVAGIVGGQSPVQRRTRVQRVAGGGARPVDTGGSGGGGPRPVPGTSIP